MIKLMLGDCLDRMTEIETSSIDFVLADPPYGTTANRRDIVIPLDPMWQQLKRVIKLDGAIAMTAGQPFTAQLIVSNIKNFRYSWVWQKNLKTGYLNAKRQPMTGYEDIPVFYKTSPTYNPQKRARQAHEPIAGNRPNTNSVASSVYGEIAEKRTQSEDQSLINPDTVIKHIKCVRKPEKRLHPNQKPVELMQYLIRTYTNPGDTVLDFAMGSGSTGEACILEQRNFIGIELYPDIFEIAHNRLA